MPDLRLPASIRTLAAALAAAWLGGCSTVGYYARLAHGEYELLAARRPVASIVADPQTDAALRRRLEVAAAARAFASDHLGLPRNASYTQYADLHRPYATWNVFAAAEFSVEPLRHCFLLVGCLAYRGYFNETDAQAEARRLQARGFDTWVGGSAAFSTLGWFADPILNTMLRRDDDELAATIFHELAHQRLFVDGDTAFNESFATFVQEQGLREWRAARGLAPVPERDDRRFEQLVLDARERLRALYASGADPAAMRQQKDETFEQLRSAVRALADADGHRGYAGWADGPMNNARLVPFGLYERWVPGFALLFARADGDWQRFYAAVEALARRDAAARSRLLDADAGVVPDAAPAH
jgi:predicted aminopeptidase